MSRLGNALLLSSMAVAGAAGATPTASNGPITKLAGEWHGRSLCVTTRRPACTDETVVYAISVVDAKAGTLKLAADKIVAGQREPMGVFDCRFETTRQQLICPMGTSQWQFRWDGRMLIGGLLDPAEGAIRFVEVSHG